MVDVFARSGEKPKPIELPYMFDLPQIVVPSFVYNAAICGLCCALSWHVLNIASDLLKKVRRPQL
jgi:hypothetical protein